MASRAVLALAKVSPAIPMDHDFTPYRLLYWSTTNGKPVLVSALISIPNARPPRGLVLWMHGTNPDRAKSVSAPSLQEGVAVSAAFAGGGYAVIAPDLVGLGVSHGPQAYLYNPSTISVTLDLLRIAARGLGGLLPARDRPFFVAGFSQGGHDAAVIHRALEASPQSPVRVRATAAIAGAYDLAEVSIPFALRGGSSGDSLYLGLVALSWSTFHGRALDTLLTAPAAKLVSQTFDGDHAADLEKALPRNPRDLFRSDFLQAVYGGGRHWFLDAARANQAHDWTPKAPYRAYFGANDVDVSPQDSLRFVTAARSRGADAEAVGVGPYGHGDSALQAVPRIRAWFDELSAGA
jgi:pimeloyl-ACP methyl ester carboxylesterase